MCWAVTLCYWNRMDSPASWWRSTNQNIHCRATSRLQQSLPGHHQGNSSRHLLQVSMNPTTVNSNKLSYILVLTDPTGLSTTLEHWSCGLYWDRQKVETKDGGHGGCYMELWHERNGPNNQSVNQSAWSLWVWSQSKAKHFTVLEHLLITVYFP